MHYSVYFTLNGAMSLSTSLRILFSFHGQSVYHKKCGSSKQGLSYNDKSIRAALKALDCTKPGSDKDWNTEYREV